ncbi:hypothetical protein GGX14DRAFT_659559 [Mycena pura]|uniref:F-box domain-containing protein n=1 Tax=Mycena pura TaxID=153505 RepID=A0AAD6V2I7_9AGAR|nr:hypothetical protein GGX14DRAFT_659559 [Mycena pura]
MDTGACPMCGGGHAYRDTSQASLLPADPAQLRASLEEVQAAILRQQALISELHRKQQELEQRLALVVYPVFTVPNEIISRIFVDCLPSHGRVCPSYRTAPLLLAQICRLWRDIALETCELWSSVNLTSKPDQADITQSLLESWLSRGKEHQLSLTLRGDFQFLGSAFIPTIAHRLWRLELSVEWTSHMKLAKNHISFPNLRQFALLGIFSENHPIPGFYNAPLLCELHNLPGSLNIRKTESAIVTSGFPDETRPLSTVDNTDIRNITSATLLSILQQFPQLLHVVAQLDDTSSGPATIAPSLQSFILYGYCSNILEFLTLPALRRLDIDERDTDHRSCLEFFKRSACPLDHLAMYLRDDGDALAACLDAVPTVTSLRIIADDTSSFARVLTATPLLVPRLATLVLHIATFENYHLQTVDLLCRRFTQGLASAEVEQFRVFKHGGWLPPDDCLAKLNGLISGGMNVKLWCDEEYWNGGGSAQQIEPEGGTY